MTRADGWYLFRGMIVVTVFVTIFILLGVRAHGQTGWVDKLQNQNHAVCCFDNDGRRLDDPEWRTAGGSFEVLFIEGWVLVPADAVVTMKNQDGIARVWSTPDKGGRTVRCFLPGAFG